MKRPVNLSLLCWVAVAMTADSSINAQDSSPASGPSAPLTWKRAVHLHDGRTFVSDGAIALDAEVAKPGIQPGQNLPEASAQVLERYLAAELPDEFALSQLTRRGRVYAAPSGVTLNPIYVDYLRRTLPASRVRFRMKSPSEPVVILLDGKAVGMLMPMSSLIP